MEDEQKIRILKRVAIVLGALIVVIFAVAAVFGYYNLTTDRPARELIFPPAEGERTLPPS